MTFGARLAAFFYAARASEWMLIKGTTKQDLWCIVCDIIALYHHWPPLLLALVEEEILNIRDSLLQTNPSQNDV